MESGIDFMKAHSIFSSRNNEQKGFTIVELLVVISISTLVIVFMIQILMSQYISALTESTRLRLRTEGQAILINLQDELLFTISYGEELEDRLIDIHEPSGGWTYDTDPQTLIINEIALDSYRRDETRNIVRQRVNNCETSSITSNPLAINNIIYYLEDNADDDFYSLRKRTVVPSYNTCSKDTDGNPCTPETATCRGLGRTTTCPDSAVTTSCPKDLTLSKNISDIQIDYYREGNVPTSIPSSAEKIEVTLVMSAVVAGQNLDVTVNHTIRKIN